MVRKLKYHEEKLLKKVDFINWELDNNLHENKIMRRYHVEKREHYTLYNKLSREVGASFALMGVGEGRTVDDGIDSGGGEEDPRPG